MAHVGCLLVILTASLTRAHLPQERDITISIGPGKEECFFETVIKGNTLSVEYQVDLNLSSLHVKL